MLDTTSHPSTTNHESLSPAPDHADLGSPGGDCDSSSVTAKTTSPRTRSPRRSAAN
ncbi:hypothetical protein DFR74_12934 [Nocardia puris]|uniref:Uncharacterized protein n=1 Tax=Nocardia puris TaxID=208602 RepID=A0A366CV63_9NOCA|nr:hypothetical protein DFR74_12934 [Nocardia puris]